MCVYVNGVTIALVETNIIVPADFFIYIIIN